MITEPVRSLIQNANYISVATADLSGQPHVAVGDQVAILGDSLLIFDNWFCPATLENITCNTHVSVVAALPTGRGYQLLGSVIRSSDTTAIAGHDPTVTISDNPHVLTRFTVRVEKVLDFTSGIHSDIPIIAT